jgi:hypothetical protein
MRDGDAKARRREPEAASDEAVEGRFQPIDGVIGPISPYALVVPKK